MSKKQTAVEWLSKQILSYKNPTNINGIDYISIPINKLEFLEMKAKQMEKEQILEAVSFGDCRGRITIYLTDEQYYNETYGK